MLKIKANASINISTLAEFKKFIDGTKKTLTCNYCSAEDGGYELFAIDNTTGIVLMFKCITQSDITDFETNLKSACDFKID